MLGYLNLIFHFDGHVSPDHSNIPAMVEAEWSAQPTPSTEKELETGI